MSQSRRRRRPGAFLGHLLAMQCAAITPDLWHRGVPERGRVARRWRHELAAPVEGVPGGPPKLAAWLSGLASLPSLQYSTHPFGGHQNYRSRVLNSDILQWPNGELTLGLFVSQGLKGMARPIACTVNLGSNGGNLFTDVVGLLLCRHSGHSHIETWVVIRFKNFTPKNVTSNIWTHA